VSGELVIGVICDISGYASFSVSRQFPAQRTNDALPGVLDFSITPLRLLCCLGEEYIGGRKSLLVRRGGREAAGVVAHTETLLVSDHPRLRRAKVGFADILLMPQPPLLTRRGMGLAQTVGPIH
jgi:hypothetical protein